MKNIKKAFTLVELLVVITILAILSVVAYQSFGGATDKAQNVTKKSNIALLGQTLETFYNDEHNYYPMPQAYSGANNLWGYDSSTGATISNKIKVKYSDQAIENIKISDTKGGGIIFASGSTTEQIAAKGVIGITKDFNKRYIKNKIYDVQLGDIKVQDIGGGKSGKMIDLGIGKFVYAVYSRKGIAQNQGSPTWNVSGRKGTYYELATTFKDTEGEGYKTYLVGNYSKDNFSNPNDYPETLIGLTQDQDDLQQTTITNNQGIPYPIDGFAE